MLSLNDVAPGPRTVGPLDSFASGWLECLRTVMTSGRDIAGDGESSVREVLNLSVSAWSATVSDFVRAGASSERIRLMVRKYHSLEVIPPYTLSYGSLFRQHEGVDQIAWLVSRLLQKLHTKSATIGFHVPGGEELSCISLFDCKIRDEALHVNVVYRSQNIFASQPGNVIALSKFQREIAKRLRVHSGLLTLHVLSAHIYHSDFARIGEVLSSP